MKGAPARFGPIGWLIVAALAGFLIDQAGRQRASHAQPKPTREPVPELHSTTIPHSVAVHPAVLVPHMPGPGAYAVAREEMVRTALEARGITDERTLQAMRVEPREEYMPAEKRAHAYEDAAVKIGWEQTISSPFMVALMSSLLEPDPNDKVLEIGTGSGYQAAILDRLAGSVYSIEILEPLCRRARGNLDRLGHQRVHIRCGDGYEGWPEAAPFDRIILTAAPPSVPEALLHQLKPGGRMVAPVGEKARDFLVILEKGADGTVTKRIQRDVAFVPMVHAKSQ